MSLPNHHHHAHPITSMRAMMRQGRLGPCRNLERLFVVLAMFAFLGTFRLHKTALDWNNNDDNNHNSGSSSSLLSPSSWAFYFTRQREIPTYIAAPLEEALMQNLDALGYNTGNERNASGCAIWHLHHQQQLQTQQQQDKQKQAAALVQLSKDLNIFRSELAHYTQVVHDFAGVEGDLRMRLTNNDQINHEICKIVDLHPNGLKGLFPSGQLSLSSSGFVEPLFPPMRHAEFCFHNNSNHTDIDDNTLLYPNYEHLMNPEYLIHDFGAMCRKLKKTSRIILVDMGASLDFHGELESPIMFLITLFYKFGFHFDHVYAHEIQFTSPYDVYSRIPMHLLPVYHWINVGVNATPGDRFNPFTQLLLQYNEDDLIIVKLDIDTPSLEMSLAQQLLTSDPPPETLGNNEASNTTDNKVVDGNWTGPRLRRLVDQFYFEHHVHLSELAELWGEDTMQGSVKDTMELFYNLRKLGVPAHFWV